jgi:peptide chain release factor subunit 1
VKTPVAEPLTFDVVRQLAAHTGSGPVTTCYLDVDGRRFVRPHDYELNLERMLRPARDREHHAGHHGVCEDLKRIEDYVRGGFDRSHTRGLALFASSADDMWRALHLPVPVRNRLVVNQHPQVRQLEAIVERAERFAVLLADRQRARLFVFQLGELVEWSELLDRLPRHEDDGGEMVKDQVRDHVDSATQHHLRHTANAVFEAFNESGFDRLVVGASSGIGGALERCLHPYLRERIAARVNVAVGAREEEVREAAVAVEEEILRAREAADVDRLRGAAAAGGGNGAVVGLDGVLGALVERRVHTLFVSDGFEAPGWRCPKCGFLASVGPSCPVCSTRMEQAADVVEEAVQEALNQSCRLEVCRANADLDVLGRIGALLRF